MVEDTARPEPNGGCLYQPEYLTRPAMIPSYRVRLVLRAANARKPSWIERLIAWSER